MSGWSSAIAWGVALLLATLAWFYAPGSVAVAGVTIDNAEMRQNAGEWTALKSSTLATWRGPYEVRWRLHLKQDERELVVRLALRGASELRCNGQLVLRNGRPAATAGEEVPGQVDRWAVLPPLPAGVHELRLLGSTQHTPAGQYASSYAVVQPMRMESMPRQRFARWLIVALAVGGLALTWLYFLRADSSASCLTSRGKVYRRTLIALGAVGLLLPLAEGARDLWGYTYPWHALRLKIILGCTALAAWLLPVSLALRGGWPTHYAWLYLWGLVLLLVALTARTYGYDQVSWCLHFMGLVAAIGLAWRARQRTNERMRELLTLMLLALALLLIFPAAFLDGLYIVTLAILMTLLMLDHAREQRARALAEAGQRQALQAQLLRASMQPHGLMNTLSILQELIDQHPALASRLVERLADQFNLLRTLSQKPLVSLREELALVRTQLDLMEMAREVPLPLTIEGPIENILLPPGILHTLVENAMTHGGMRVSAPAFALNVAASDEGGWRIELRSPRGAGREGGGGQGQRFVRESLAGAFTTDWAYETGPLDDNVWLDCLSVPKR